MSFLLGRVGFDATYYNSNCGMNLFRLAFPKTTGYNFRCINAGTVENKGIELTVFATR